MMSTAFQMSVHFVMAVNHNALFYAHHSNQGEIAFYKNFQRLDNTLQAAVCLLSFSF